MFRFTIISLIAAFNLMASFPTEKDVIIFADIIDQHLMTSKNNLRRNDSRVLEFLLYKNRLIVKSLANEESFYKKFTGERRLYINKKNKQIIYKRGNKGRKLDIIASYTTDQQVNWVINKKRKQDYVGKLDTTNLTDEYLDSIKTKIYEQVQMQKGYDSFQMSQNIALNADSDIKLEKIEGKTKLLRIKEKIIRNNKFDNSEWKYVPVKLIAYPAQKIMYEIPELFTGLAIESVTRSPIHNFQGAVDEAAGAGKSFYNGFIDLFRGILKPKKASSIDGLLTIVDGGFKVVKTGFGIAKSAVSFVGYPLYRLLGGKKSKRVALKGKRAAIVFIDTGIDGGVVDTIVDTYGESIIRNQLKSISNYYCVTSNAEDNSITDCIDQMPDSIEYVDFFGLTHSGADSTMERYAKYATETKGVKPELIVSIGCYDDPSTMVEKENTVGQEKTSWAVHYYLSNLISKRLRGIPMEVAANEAFYGAMPINAVNPISLGAVAAIGLGMEDNLKDGYFGSKPDIMTNDRMLSLTIEAAWSKVFMNSAKFYYDSMYERDHIKNMSEEEVSKLIEQNIEIIFKANDFLSIHLNNNSSQFTKESRMLFENSKVLLDDISNLKSLKEVFSLLNANGSVTINKGIKRKLSLF